MMQMAHSFPPHGGMAPGPPSMQHGQPMGGMQHPGSAHMGGHPGPGMMHGMHPGVPGPQVTQGPMGGMPPGVAATSGMPMQNAHAMAHLGPAQQGMMPQQHVAFANMPPVAQQQQLMLQRRQVQMMAAAQQQQQQQHGMPMNMPNGGQLNQGQMAQLKAMQMQHPQGMQMQQMAANQQQQQQNFQQQQMMARHQVQQQMALQAQAQAHQRAAAQQMQMSRSQEQATQAPPSHPTPAPQSQPQSQPQATPKPQHQPQPQQPQQPPGNQPQPQHVPNRPPQADQQPQQDDAEANQPDMMDELGPPPTMNQEFSGRMILHLLQFQQRLQSLEHPDMLDSWQDFVHTFFSPQGFVRQQILNTKTRTDKKFQIPFASLARFFHSHFQSGIRRIIMSTFDCQESLLPNGGHNVISPNASFTYVYANNIRVTTIGSVQVNFDPLNKIEGFSINTKDWSEYIPRQLLQQPESPDQKQDLKINKGVKRQQSKAPSEAVNIPKSTVGDHGLPSYMLQFLEIAEVMTAMGPLFEYYQSHPGISPREALNHMAGDNGRRMMQMQMQMQMQNPAAMMMNGQMHPQGARTPGMNGPNQFNSPGMAHLGLPNAQGGSPHIGGPVHTPSPAQHHVGGTAMMHQMSQQGSNLSGSQGPSTNTSPNVSNKRRRASQIKLEEENSQGGGGGDASANRVKPSPKMTGKRQKGS